MGLQGKRLVFVTNNSTKSRKQYGKKFESLGLDVSEVRFVTLFSHLFLFNCQLLCMHTAYISLFNVAGGDFCIVVCSSGLLEVNQVSFGQEGRE